MRGTSMMRQLAGRWRLATWAFVVMLGWAVLIGKGEPTGRAAAGDDAKGALPADLARILPDSFVIASINIDAIWNSEAAKGVREKALKSFPDLFQEFEKLVGVDIKDIERI